MYQRNNIQFRRVSASHFVTFFQTKEFMLGEILGSGKHSFSPTAREILLQYFSVVTDILVAVERECIGRSDGMVNADLRNSCSQILRNGLMEMRNRVTEHPNDFDPCFAQIWTDILDETVKQIGNQLARVLSVDIYTSFGRLVTYCCGYLSHILKVLHEIDYLMLDGSEPFMYLDCWDLLMMVDEELSTTEVRLNSYKAHGLLDGISTLVVKSEVDDEWLRTDPQRIVAYQYAVDLFHRHSIGCVLQPRS